jgi:hypothetical protein
MTFWEAVFSLTIVLLWIGGGIFCLGKACDVRSRRGWATAASAVLPSCVGLIVLRHGELIVEFCLASALAAAIFHRRKEPHPPKPPLALVVGVVVIFMVVADVFVGPRLRAVRDIPNHVNEVKKELRQ